MIIRGENVTERATLSPSGQLCYVNSSHLPGAFVEEECKQAFGKGKKQGEKLGYERALCELSSLLGILQSFSHKLLEYKHQLLEQLKPEVVAFAISVCERIVRKELSQPESFIRLINSLLVYATQSIRGDPVKLILSPDDLVMLENHLSKIHYDKREMESLSFHSDSQLQRGDVRLETPSTLLNYTLSRQLADLQSKVLQG